MADIPNNFMYTYKCPPTIQTKEATKQLLKLGAKLDNSVPQSDKNSCDCKLCIFRFIQKYKDCDCYRGVIVWYVCCTLY